MVFCIFEKKEMKVLAKDLERGNRIELVIGMYKVVETVIIKDKSNATIYFTDGSRYFCFPDDEMVTISEDECIKRGIKEYNVV